jgi:2-polyprenyl-3-methyl-5-hydroxy-6-metoxy-1,4-benzoquinol methylase
MYINLAENYGATTEVGVNDQQTLRTAASSDVANCFGSAMMTTVTTPIDMRQIKSAGEEHACVQRTGRDNPFSFGRNWQDFVNQRLNSEREQIALRSLREFLELPDLQDYSFCDVGCGSGLFSLAAHRLGARHIISIDVDPFSVQCCQQLRQSVGAPENWTVAHGSVLSREFLVQFGQSDIVYAWGSLHHTGRMWEAIRNTSDLLLGARGRLYLSIYNRVEGRGSSDYWLRVKKRYNRSSKIGKLFLENVYALRYDIMPRLVRFQNPLTFINTYSRGRGMDYWTDVRDWLGGYPYECASADEIFNFCKRQLNLELVNLRVTNTLGTNEFLFSKK